ncbi:MAG TPA: hypothetical protein VI258_13480 [Rhodanobacteraceae bacterium]
MRMRRLLFAFLLAFSTFAAAAEAPPADFAWPNLTDFLQQLIAKVGAPVKVYKLEIDRDGKVDLWIQDQGKPDLVDSYEYDHGVVSPPIPVKFDHYPSVAAVDHHVIELTTIDFQRLPSMLAAAKAKLGLPDAKVSLIALERGDSSGFLTFSDIPIWTFSLSTPRHDGRVEFSLDGKVLDADKD